MRTRLAAAAYGERARARAREFSAGGVVAGDRISRIAATARERRLLRLLRVGYDAQVPRLLNTGVFR